MATYVIGDIQGCYVELQLLLQLIDYDVKNDLLWFVGDLVNRGPESLQVLRFVANLPQKVVVLGNHDLHLIALYHGCNPLNKDHSLDAILTASDAPELIDWLRQQPLLHYDAELNYVMTHAGIYPWWSLTKAKKLAVEAEQKLRSNNYIEYLVHMYGDQPSGWSEQLSGMERWRFILNAFIRMRFANGRGELDFVTAGPAATAPPGFKPWYAFLPNDFSTRLIFGHWAALQGECDRGGVFALDTGCVWGGALTAMRLEDQQRFSVPCRNSRQ